MPKNFKQKLRHQVVEAEALRVEVVQKLPLLHPWFIRLATGSILRSKILVKHLNSNLNFLVCFIIENIILRLNAKTLLIFSAILTELANFYSRLLKKNLRQ